MYESYWQLTQKPFENCADERFYFPGESHQAALLKLRYAVENRRAAALLTGIAGSGKTLIARMLRSSLNNKFSPFVHLVFPQMPADQLLWYMAEELDGLGCTSESASVQHSVRRIEHFLAENCKQGRHAVVVVDEAHLIDNSDTLESLRLLMNFESSGTSGMTLILVGQTSLLPVLERTPQLDERFAVKCLIRTFTEQETADYVSHRLKTAGAVQAIFEPQAMPTLQALTQGVARRINRLCDLALLIGFADQRDTIGTEQLEAVSNELVAVVPE